MTYFILRSSMFPGTPDPEKLRRGAAESSLKARAPVGGPTNTL